VATAVRGEVLPSRARPDGEAALLLAPLRSAFCSEPMLPAYIQQAPDPTWTSLPRRTQPELDLSEGPHLGYAFQWFIFAAILGIGYPFFINRREKELSINTINTKQAQGGPKVS